MALSINNNLMALTAFNNLTRSYSSLSKSVSKLSSGLRINSAADDAAGLAVRELMRSDIAVLNQGIRNANDAISMLQTMDGASQVIDEKLIRMKELAEQAATGTYSTAQRTIMNQEFSAMRNEIERIANATDFNGIKLLNGVSGTTTGAATEVQQVLADVHTAAAAGSAVVAFTSFNSGDTITVSWTEHDGTLGAGGTITMTNAMTNTAFATAINNLTSAAFDVAFVNDGGAASNTDYLQITDGTTSAASQISMVLNTGGGAAEYTAATSTTGAAGTTVSNVKIHFGTGADATEDYYYVNAQDMTSSGLGVDALAITTQASAQAALGTIDTAILAKDTARAHFGASINRLENTVSNLTIQAENIAAAESQISDVDVASEMTQFVNTQIKAQAAVAMLAQANTMPQMALTLLGG
jgi:flagellin